MKIVYVLLFGAILFASAGVLQAQEDPYSGTYNCSGSPQEGCGTGEFCQDAEIYPPSRLVITKSGDSYQICPEFDLETFGRGNGDDCVVLPIQDGVAHWSGTTSGEGGSFTGEATLTFSGSTISAEESGKVTGTCNCDVSLHAICTK